MSSTPTSPTAAHHRASVSPGDGGGGSGGGVQSTQQQSAKMAPSNSKTGGFFDIRVSDYYLIGDGSMYESHLFTIVVKVDEIMYSVDRSYVDFVELDKYLRKRFPKSAITSLPLDAASIVEKTLYKADPSKRRSSTGGLRDSLVGIENLLGGQRVTPIRLQNGRPTENIASKVKALDIYLSNLLNLHEVVTSDELMLFLDEEAPNMHVNPSSLEPLSVYDLLLMNETLHKCTVSRVEEHFFPVKKGQIILWRFTTSNYDIGFSVEMNNETKLGFSRHKSHERPICGALDANTAGVCKLIWDNSYAKLHSKELSWSARVVSSEDYQSAKSQALEVQREKRKFEEQRHVLNRCAISHASVLSGVIQSSSIVNEIVNDHAHSEMKRVRDLDEQILRYKKEIAEYQSDFDHIQLEYSEMEASKASVQEAFNQMRSSWRFTMQQLEQCQKDFAQSRSEVTDLQLSNSKLLEQSARDRDELAALKLELLESRYSHKQLAAESSEKIESQQAELQSCYAKIQDLTEFNRVIIGDRAADEQQSIARSGESLAVPDTRDIKSSGNQGGSRESSHGDDDCSNFDGNSNPSNETDGNVSSSDNISIKKDQNDLDEMSYLNKIEELKKELSSAKSSIVTLTSSNTGLGAKNKGLTDRIQVLQDRITALVEQLDNVSPTKIPEIAMSGGGVSSNASGGGGASEARIEEYEAMIAKMQHHFTTLSIKYTIAGEKIDELSIENEDNKKLLTSLENKGIFTQFQTMRSDIKRLEGCVAGYKSVIADISTCVTRSSSLHRESSTSSGI